MTFKNFNEDQKKICSDLMNYIINNNKSNSSLLLEDCISNLFVDYSQDEDSLEFYEKIDTEMYLKTIQCFLQKIHRENYDWVLNAL